MPVGPMPIEELCGEIKRCGKLVLKRRNDELATARGAFLISLLEYAGNKAGLEAAVQILQLVHAFNIIDAGYRLIHERLVASPIASRSPQTRLSSVLLRTVADYEKVRGKMFSRAKRRPPKFYTHFGPRYDTSADGIPIHSDDMLSALVESASKVLTMESLANNWFDNDGDVARVPCLILDGGEEEPDLVLELRVAATSWRDWNDIEERFRFLGGDFKIITRDEMPTYVSAQIILAIAYEPTMTSLQFELDMRVAEERQVDKMFTWRMQGSVIPDDLPALGDVDRGRVQLPPNFVVSTEERHALLTLSEIFGFDELFGDKRHGGLRLVEWLRGYATLQYVARKTFAAGTTSAERLLPARSKDQVCGELMRFGFTRDTADLFFDRITFRRSSRDLYDAPLIAVQDGGFIVFGPGLLDAQLTLVVLSALSHGGLSIDMKGRAFEEDVLGFLKDEGFNAQRVAFSRDGEDFEFDIVFPWDNYLFVLECKNRSLPAGRAEQMYRFREALAADIAQVVRLTKALQSYTEPFVSRFGSDVTAKVVVPCVLHSRTFGHRGDVDGIYFTDASAFMRFFRGPTIDFTQVGRSSDGMTRRDIPMFRIWKGDKPTPDELIQSLRDPVQLRYMAEKLEARQRFSLLGNRCVSLAPYVVRKDVVFDDVLATLTGDAASVQTGIDAVTDLVRGLTETADGRAKGEQRSESDTGSSA